MLVASAAAVLCAVGLAAEVYWWDTYWGQWVGGNVLPPSFWTLVGIGLAHLHSEFRADQRHADMKQHVTEQTGDNG